MERPKRILIVDDDEKHAALVQTILDALGYESVTCRKGSAPLQPIGSGIDLVLLNAVTPDSDGYRVVREIRESPSGRDIPIVIASVHSEKEALSAAIEAGADDFVCKPIDGVELQTRISSLLRMKDIQEALKSQQTEIRVLVSERKRIEAEQEKARLDLERLAQQRPAEYVCMNRNLEEDIREQRRDEEALRESEARRSNFFEQASDLLYITDTHGHFTSVNSAVERILGYTPEEFVELNFRDVIVQPCLRTAEESFRKEIDGELEKTGPYEVLVKRRDGSLVWLEVLSQVVKKEEIPVAIRGSARDISARKEMEEHLKQSEAKYRMIFENSPLGLFHFDGEGTITACNENFVEIIGSSREALIGLDTLRDLKDPKIVAAIRKALSGGIGHYEDYYASITADKTTPVKCDFGPIFGENGSVIGGIAIVEDITQRKKAEEALRESEAKYRTILETIADGYHEVDLKGTLKLVNDFMRGITGYSREELLGMNYRRLVHNDSRGQVFMAYNWVYRTGRANPGVAFRLVRKDGALRDVTVSVSLIRDSHGDPCGFRGTIRDVTERKALEEQLRQAAKTQAIGQLAGGIAHDFNNLLTAMMGYTNMLVHQLPPEGPYQDELAQISRAAERAAALTQQLLAYGRKQVLNASHLNLNPIVKDFETMLKSIVGETIQIEIILEEHLWTVHADPSQMEQILMNLAVNARDAMTDGGTLRVETCNATLDNAGANSRPDLPPGDYVMVSVSDTGIGMDAETIARIFDPFFTTKEKGVGTGLGLSTVYGIVKQHRGHVTVRSQPGAGAAFEVYLPRVDVIARQPPETPHAEIEPGGFETVLVVEDEQLVRDLTCEALKLLGYRTLAAAAPEEALGLVQHYGGPIDLLLTDVVLPQMDGRSLYNKLAESFSDLRVVYMSGYTEDFIVHRGVLDPDVRFLQKPFTMTDLARTVREVLGKSSEPAPVPGTDC